MTGFLILFTLGIICAVCPPLGFIIVVLGLLCASEQAHTKQ